MDVDTLLNYVNFLCHAYYLNHEFLHLFHFLSQYCCACMGIFFTTCIEASTKHFWDLKKTISGEEVNVRIQKFSDTKFSYWRMQIEHISMGRDSTFLC